MNNVELIKYIKNEFNQYKKQKNNNDEFFAQILQKAETHPSPAWVKWAPTKKAAYELQIIETKLLAQNLYHDFENKSTSLSSVVNMCYTSCIGEDKNFNKSLDQNMLTQWQNAFKPVLPEFTSLLLNNVVKKWDASNKKFLNITENLQSTVTTKPVTKNKM
jgi:hypothetical protein